MKNYPSIELVIKQNLDSDLIRIQKLEIFLKSC